MSEFLQTKVPPETGDDFAAAAIAEFDRKSAAAIESVSKLQDQISAHLPAQTGSSSKDDFAGGDPTRKELPVLPPPVLAKTAAQIAKMPQGSPGSPSSEPDFGWDDDVVLDQ